MRVGRLVAALAMTLVAWSGMSAAVLAADETPSGSQVASPAATQ